jgi:hypothetical protein
MMVIIHVEIFTFSIHVVFLLFFLSWFNFVLCLFPEHYTLILHRFVGIDERIFCIFHSELLNFIYKTCPPSLCYMITKVCFDWIICHFEMLLFLLFHLLCNKRLLLPSEHMMYVFQMTKRPWYWSMININLCFSLPK